MADAALTPAAAAGTDAAIWAELLALLIRLHDREADANLVARLHAADAPSLFAALFAAAGAGADDGAAALLDAALRDLGPCPTPEALDEMAADYADLYLTHGYRAAPTGSVWMTEDHLERQEPMFEVRAWYDHYDLRVPDWRLRPDDHIVHELQFVRHLLNLGSPDALSDAARFLDQHVLGWAPEFCTQAVQRVRTLYHAAAAALTVDFLAALRDWLTAETGIAPEIRGNAYARARDREARAAEAQVIDRPFVPGLEPGW